MNGNAGDRYAGGAKGSATPKPARNPLGTRGKEISGEGDSELEKPAGGAEGSTVSLYTVGSVSTRSRRDINLVAFCKIVHSGCGTTSGRTNIPRY